MNTVTERLPFGGVLLWLLGVVLCLTVNFAVTLVLVEVFGQPSGTAFFVGIYQLVYNVPLAFVLYKRANRHLASGFTFALVVAFLISAAILTLGSLGLLSA